MRFFICIWILINITSCTTSSKFESIHQVDIENNAGKYTSCYLSEITDQLEYIPLESNNQNMIGTVKDVLVTKNRIFIIGLDHCFEFARDGKFLQAIGKKGRGTGEYMYISSVSVDEENDMIYLEDSNNSLLEYSWSGEYRRSIPLPVIDGQKLSNAMFFGNNQFIGYASNMRGNAQNKFCLFDHDGNVVEEYPNHVSFKRKGHWISRDDEIYSYFSNNGLYIKQYDTLFCLNSQSDLIPQAVFSLGKYAIPLSAKEKTVQEFSKLDNYILIYSLSGTTSHVFFTYSLGKDCDIPLPASVKKNNVMINGKMVGMTESLAGLYHWDTQKTIMLDNDPVSGMRGFTNNLDGGLSFWPRYNSTNELVDVWLAEDMKEILTEKYFAAHDIKDQAAHQKLRELLKNLHEEDNPVIVIAKLK